MGILNSKSSRKIREEKKLTLPQLNKTANQFSLKNHLSIYKIIENKDISSSPYPIINNIAEINRLKQAHKTDRILWGNNCSAPAKEMLESRNATVLDIGCGSGDWMLDMAYDYPMSNFIGVDFVTMFPKTSMQNVGFLKYDVLNGIPFPDNTFDYVHQKNLMLAFTEAQWVEVIEEIIRVTKPGGWIEIIECDCEIYQPGPVTKLLDLKLKSVIASRGIDYNLHKSLPNIIDKANLIDDIILTTKQLPLNTNDGTLGRMGKEMLLNAGKLLTENFDGMHDNTYESILAELDNPNYKSYLSTTRICAKKVL